RSQRKTQRFEFTLLFRRGIVFAFGGVRRTSANMNGVNCLSSSFSVNSPASRMFGPVCAENFPDVCLSYIFSGRVNVMVLPSTLFPAGGSAASGFSGSGILIVGSPHKVNAHA